jgi:ribose transport system ATP-binding protein
MGCARESVVRALFGIQPIDAGEIRVKGRRHKFAHPGHAIRAGIGYMPADRKKEGLVLGMAVHDNLVLPVLRRVSRAGLLSRLRRRDVANRMVRDLEIRLASTSTEVVNLSGGNQQKVVIGKWLAHGGDVLLVEEPTRGVDVGAKPQIWAALHELADAGKGVLLVSSELPELMGVCDRILVMSCGRMTGSFTRDTFSAEAIARCAVEVPSVRTTTVHYQ